MQQKIIYEIQIKFFSSNIAFKKCYTFLIPLLQFFALFLTYFSTVSKFLVFLNDPLIAKNIPFKCVLI